VNEANQITFSFAPEIIPQGGGSYLVKPGKPIVGRRKLTTTQAAEMSGISADSIRRLYSEGFIEGERPSPGRILVYADSVQTHCDRTRDQEFWHRKNHLKLYLEGLKK
jgi:hypothetical protein